MLAAATAVAAALLLSIATVRGGNCWSGMSRGGRCTDLLQERVSREQCCALGAAGGGAGAAPAAGPATAWSEQDMDAGMLFFWRVLGGGVPCQACRDSCAGVSCGPGRRCAVRWGRPQCVCSPDCAKKSAKHAMRQRLAVLGASSSPSSSSSSRHRGGGPHGLRGPHGQRGPGPVCGSDGRSYRSACRLLKRACRRKTSSLVVDYHGTCQSSCAGVHCGPGRSCVQDQNLSPHCVHCEQHCPAAGRGGASAVCGADGLTYPSSCHLRQAACRAGKAIPVAYPGRCQKVASCGAVHCRRHQTCLTDLTSGAPRCVTCSLRCSRAAAKDADAKATAGASKRRRAGGSGFGSGGFGIRSSGSGGARLRELMSLDAVVQSVVPEDGPVCGTNNRTYTSWCHMRRDACATGYVIDTRHPGPCSPAPGPVPSASSPGGPGAQRAQRPHDGGDEPAPHLNAVLDEINAFP